MPISEYFGGKGEKVLAELIKKHGKKKGTQIFYATANKQGMKPEDKVAHARAKRRKK